jgi:alpha/beta superfamily hydrolase
MSSINQIIIPGPTGNLEGLLSLPDRDDEKRVAIICHPHPLHGGTMTNKVVHTLDRATTSQGIPSFRFNFRGVGKSDGDFDNAIGEVNDALAVVEFARAQYPGRDVVLAGFSFGAYISLCASQYLDLTKLITIAPAVNMYNLEDFQAPLCPWLLLQGDEDEIVPVTAVKSWAAQVFPPPELQLMPDTGHFFHGKLVQLKEIVTDFLTT